MPELRESLLFQILSQPSAPFREKHVIDTVSAILTEGQVPFFQDPIGNLVLGVASKKEYLAMIREKTSEPLRIFIAHMDHPGFHGAKWRSDSELEIKWHGGSPYESVPGAKVWLAHGQGPLGHAHFTEVKLHSSGRAIGAGVVRLDAESISLCKDIAAQKIYGGFAFRAPFWQEGELIYTKAADDLVGTYAIVSLALDFCPPKKKRKHPFIGLLTRAEEVGFIGAIGHFEQNWLTQARRPLLGVSLETSRTLPGAEIGKGPVVRLGDRTTVFDSGSIRVFSGLANRALPGQHQRRIMDGGTCEATAATVYGIPCVGISIPLGNYHNQNLEGGPDSTPGGSAPEFVHLNDIRGLLELCHALVKPKLNWDDPWASKLKEFRKDLREYRALLKSGP